MNEWIKYSVEEKQLNPATNVDVLFFPFNDCKFGYSLIVLPQSKELIMRLSEAGKNPVNLRNFLISIIRSFGEWIAFHYDNQGTKRYFIVMKDRRIGDSNFPRMFVPKELSQEPLFRSCFENIYLTLNNVSPTRVGLDYFSYTTVVDTCLDYSKTDTDFMFGFMTDNLKMPTFVFIVNCESGPLKFLVPNTDVFKGEYNRNNHTKRWVVDCASREWYALKLSNGKYIIDILDNNDLEIGSYPYFFIMPCILESSVGKKLIEDQLIAKINIVLESKGLKCFLEKCDSDFIINYRITPGQF